MKDLFVPVTITVAVSPEQGRLLEKALTCFKRYNKEYVQYNCQVTGEKHGESLRCSDAVNAISKALKEAKVSDRQPVQITVKLSPEQVELLDRAFHCFKRQCESIAQYGQGSTVSETYGEMQRCLNAVTAIKGALENAS